MRIDAATETELLKSITPGSLLRNLSNDDWGLFTVIHAHVEEYPGLWLQLHVTALNQQLGLVDLDAESTSFLERWRVVHRA